MFYLHSKSKDTNENIIILGRKTFKVIKDEKDRYWDGHSDRDYAEKFIKELEAMSETHKFWTGVITIVEKS